MASSQLAFPRPSIRRETWIQAPQCPQEEGLPHRIRLTAPDRSRHAIYTGPTGVKNFVLASPQRPSYDVQPPARLRYARAAPHPRRGPAVPKMDLESADSDLPSRALNDTPWADSLRSRSLPRQVQTAVKKGIVARAAGELKRARGCRSVRSSSPGLFWSHTSLPSPS